MTKFAVIGIGRMGGTHAKNLVRGRMKGSELVAVCDIDRKKVDAFCKKHPKVKGYYNHHDLLNDRIAEAVMIAVPHYFHGEIAKDCISAGVHTLVEKPLTVTTLEAKSVIECAEQHPDVYFGMMFNQRTNLMYKKAKELIEKGVIGKIQRANYVITDWYRSQAYYDQGGWRASWSGEGGGTLINQCVHQLDLIQWLLGMPKSITAKCKTVGRKISTENELYAIFDYGFFDCYFCASTHELPGENRLTIVGTKGTIVIESTKMKYTVLHKSETKVNAETKHGYGNTGRTRHSFGYGTFRYLTDKIYGQQWRVIEAFGEAVDNRCRSTMIAEGKDGLKALTLINGIYLSDWTQSAVQLPFDDRLYADMLKEHAEAEKNTAATPVVLPEAQSESLPIAEETTEESAAFFDEKMYGLGSKRSVIRDLFEYGKNLAAEKGADAVYDFSLGNPSIPAPEAVKTSIQKQIDTEKSTFVHGYSSAQGDADVRGAIAEHIKNKFGATVSPNHIYLTVGAAAALTISLKALHTEGDNFVAFAPFFPEYRVFAEGTGASFKVVPMRSDCKPDTKKAAEVIDKDTKAVIINSPNNPSGAVYSEEEIKAICALLESKSKEYGHPIFLISDEPYREIAYDGVFVPYPMNYYKNTVICYSYSKSLSLPGERIGYIALHPDCEKVDEIYFAVCGAGRVLGYVCAPHLFQRVLKDCVDAPTDVEAYDKNRKLLYDRLTEYGYTCIKPQGAFYLMVKTPEEDAGAFSDKAKELGLLLVPGDSFGAPGFVRISYCVSYEMIERSLPAFKQLKELYSK